ncbi:DUF973 family protein [Sulfurisphaera javensis]
MIGKLRLISIFILTLLLIDYGLQMPSFAILSNYSIPSVMNTNPTTMFHPVKIPFKFTLTIANILVNAQSSQQSVTFNIVNNQYISGSYTTTISVSPTTLTPNSTNSVSVSISGNKLPITINIPPINIGGTQVYSGGQFQLTINALGTFTCAIPGLTINAFVFSGGGYISVIGEIVGYVNVSGDGTTSTQKLCWTSPGAQKITIETSNVKSGNVVLDIYDLSYVLSICVFVKASSALGGSTQITVIPQTQVGSFKGDPSSVQFDLSVSSSIFPELSLPILLPLVSVPLLVGGVVAYRRKRKGGNKSRPKVSSTPQYTYSQPSIKYVYAGAIRRTGAIKLVLNSTVKARIVSIYVEGTNYIANNITPSEIQPGNNVIRGFLNQTPYSFKQGTIYNIIMHYEVNGNLYVLKIPSYYIP